MSSNESKMKSLLQPWVWITILMGFLFSLLSWKIMSLDFRYALAACAAVGVVSCAMAAIWFIDDFLVYVLVFNIPFSIFGKWLMAHPIAVPAKGISIGLAELILTIAYGMWFFKIFVIRSEPLPSLTKLDFLIMFLIICQMISLIGAPDKALAFFDIVYNIKYALIYFFLAHKVRRRHLKWIIVMICFAIMMQGSLAIYERMTGNVAIGVTKGNVKSEKFGTQGKVPGVEDEIRGAGTTIDPHSLGLYLAMTLPFPLVFLMMHYAKPSRKLLCGLVFLIGIGGLIVTFSRSGWLSFAISSLFAIWFIFFRWLHDRGIFALLAILLVLTPFYPKFFNIIDKKLFNAPSSLIDVRIDMAKTALNIWMHDPFFGYGAGNYLEAIDDPDIINYGHYGKMADRPVHNAYLWLLAEIGLFGMLSYVGIIFMAMAKCFRYLNSHDGLIKGMALALLSGFIAYLLDGMTNMMFREAVPYAQLWTAIALSMGLERFIKEAKKPGNSANTMRTEGLPAA